MFALLPVDRPHQRQVEREQDQTAATMPTSAAGPRPNRHPSAATRRPRRNRDLAVSQVDHPGETVDQGEPDPEEAILEAQDDAVEQGGDRLHHATPR